MPQRQQKAKAVLTTVKTGWKLLQFSKCAPINKKGQKIHKFHVISSFRVKILTFFKVSYISDTLQLQKQK